MLFCINLAFIPLLLRSIHAVSIPNSKGSALSSFEPKRHISPHTSVMEIDHVDMECLQMSLDSAKPERYETPEIKKLWSAINCVAEARVKLNEHWEGDNASFDARIEDNYAIQSALYRKASLESSQKQIDPSNEGIIIGAPSKRHWSNENLKEAVN
jgi:hypothetical protein